MEAPQITVELLDAVVQQLGWKAIEYRSMFAAH